MIKQDVRMKWNLFFAVSLLVSVQAYSQTDSKESEASDPVVAEVLGTKITKSALDKYFQDKLNFVSGKKVTKESALNDLIDRAIGIEKAKKAGLHKDPEVIKKMNDILYHAQISKDLEGKLLQIKVSDDEVREYYKVNPEYRTAQILYRLRVNPSPEELADTINKANASYAELQKKPDSFSEMAAQFGQTANSPVGGDLGFQPKTRLTPEFYAAIKGKSAGFITKPFRSQYGYHIVKVIDVKKFEDIDKNLYKKIIYDIKRDQILDQYFAENRKTANVKIFKDKL